MMINPSMKMKPSKFGSEDFLAIQRMVKELKDDKDALRTHIEILNKSLQEKDNQIKISNNENLQNENIKSKLIKKLTNFLDN